MAGKGKFRRVVDEVNAFPCKCGVDIVIREEVFQDDSGEVVRYNLAFIHFGITHKDHGRVLGYNNAHGHHERHLMGSVEAVDFVDYETTLERFLDEVGKLRKQHEKHRRR